MTEADLPQLRGWLQQPHVARWWAQDKPVEEELEQYRQRLTGEVKDSTHMLMIVERGQAAVGWCQWYRWDDEPAEAEDIGALPDECGFDYAIGDPAAIGRGLGTAMNARLVAEIRRHEPGCGLIVAPEAANTVSRRVLERNGFALIDVRPLAFEPHDRPMAIYRLAGGG